MKLVIHETIIPAISKGDQMVNEMRLLLVKLLEGIPAILKDLVAKDSTILINTVQEIKDIATGLQELLRPTHLNVSMPAVQGLMETKSNSRSLVAAAIKQNKWWSERHVDLVKSSVAAASLLPELEKAAETLQGASAQEITALVARYAVWADSLREGVIERS